LVSYRRRAGKKYSRNRRAVRLESLKTRKWGVIKYPRGTKPVVVEAKVEGMMGRKPYVQTVVIKEGVGITKETDIPAVIKVLQEKAENELPADTKAEFSIYLPKTRKKPVKFVALGGQPLELRLVVPSGGFEVPEELREDIRKEWRKHPNRKTATDLELREDIRKEWRKHPNRKTATDLEVMAYLMSASALGPLDTEHVRIYLYLARKYLKSKEWKSFMGSLAFLNEYKSLSNYEKRLLQKLKDNIWKDQQRDLVERRKRARQLAKACPGGKIRSGGKGLGLGRGRGKGPIGVPVMNK